MHTDAVQGFCKIPFTVKSLGADLITLSSHKIHGPKGVGALYVRKGLRVPSIIIGGGQEGGYRSGTENTVGIVGFGAAAEEARAKFASNVGIMTSLRDLCQIKAEEAGARANIPAGLRAPHVLSLTLPSIKSETMLHFLSSENIFVSSGSACSSNSQHKTSALVAFGRSEAEADTSIRISFSHENEKADVDALCEALAKGLSKLSRMR